MRVVALAAAMWLGLASLTNAESLSSVADASKECAAAKAVIIPSDYELSRLSKHARKAMGARLREDSATLDRCLKMQMLEMSRKLTSH